MATKHTKATPEQIGKYRGVYPLWGYITIDGRVCPIEYIGDADNDIKYEVLCPDGFYFDPDGTHTRLVANLRELHNFASYTRVVIDEEKDE